MKILSDLFENFNTKFSNIPIQFEEGAKGNGLTKTFQLSFYPIYDIADYRPTIVINTGTYLAPVWTLQEEGVDYSVNFEVGQITFNTAPAELLNGTQRVINIKITAFHCKINLKYFISFYNLIINNLDLYYPLREFRQILSSELGLTDGQLVDYIDLNELPFSNYKRVLEIFQNEKDEKHIVFRKRENRLYPDITSNGNEHKYLYGPTDYNKVVPNNSAKLYTPFWISGLKKYPKFDIINNDPNSFLNSETYINDDNSCTEFVLIRIAIEMYKMRLQFSERMNASTLRISTIKDINSLIMTLTNDLQRHIISYAPGTGHLPDYNTL